MSFPISISKTSEQLPIDPLLVVTRTAIGLGLGILMADRIKPPLRQAAAIALVAIGALAAAPWLQRVRLYEMAYSSERGCITPLQQRFGNRIRKRFAFSR